MEEVAGELFSVFFLTYMETGTTLSCGRSISLSIISLFRSTVYPPFHCLSLDSCGHYHVNMSMNQILSHTTKLLCSPKNSSATSFPKAIQIFSPGYYSFSRCRISAWHFNNWWLLVSWRLLHQALTFISLLWFLINSFFWCDVPQKSSNFLYKPFNITQAVMLSCLFFFKKKQLSYLPVFDERYFFIRKKKSLKKKCGSPLGKKLES